MSPDPIPVRRVGGNTLRTATVPIVFVPGVMGSRLQGPNLLWDPDSTRNMLDWATNRSITTRRRLATDNPAVVMTTARDGRFTQQQLDRGWAGIVWSVYQNMMGRLDAARFGRFSTPVYAVGYDWRQDNRTSGQAVATRIGEILAQTQAQQYILISHSMGGLVTRAMLKGDGGVAGKALGVVHIAQPALGATVFYRRMFTGAMAGPDGGRLNPPDIVFRNIVGTTRESFQTILGVLPGPMQLMVTPQYRDTGGAAWLSLTPFETAQRQEVAVQWGSYLQPASPAGLFAPQTEPYALSAEHDQQLRALIVNAQAFHDELGDYKHPRTWSIFGSGVETDMATHFDLPPATNDGYRPGVVGRGGQVMNWRARRSDGTVFRYRHRNPSDRGCVPVRREDGDGTVPAPSAQGLFPGEAHPVREHTTDYEQSHQFEIRGGGAGHNEICHHPQALACMFDLMRHLLGSVPP